ncbi:hypothetical protein ACOMHN_042290 [Nucella lapillus]
MAVDHSSNQKRGWLMSVRHVVKEIDAHRLHEERGGEERDENSDDMQRGIPLHDARAMMEARHVFHGGQGSLLEEGYHHEDAQKPGK